MAKQQPRGIRNNNPGNIEYSSGTKWQGLDSPPTDGRFARFVTPAWGIRALARVLITYQDKHGLDSVEAIINRWAPPGENDTRSYVAAVARAVGVGAGDRVSVHDYGTLAPLVQAIIQHENGQQPYGKAVIDEGLRLAGAVESRPLVKEPEAQVGGGAILTGAGITADNADKIFDAVDRGRGFFADPGNLVMTVAGLGVVGFGIFLVLRPLLARKRVEG